MDKTNKDTFLLLFVVLVWNISTVVNMEKNCTLNQSSKSPGILHLEGKDTFIDALYQFSFSGKSCVVDMTNVLDINDKRINDSALMLAMVFTCGPTSYTEIRFTTHSLNNPNSTFLLYFVISSHCIISVDTLVAINKCTSTAVYKLFEAGGKVTGGTEAQACLFTNTLREMGLELQQNQSNVLELCTNTFPILATLTLQPSGSSPYSLPSSVIRSMQQRFPNLQQLFMVDIYLEEKLNFPWIGTQLPYAANNSTDKKTGNIDKETETDSKTYMYNKYFKLIYSTSKNVIIEDCIHLKGSLVIVEISGLTVKRFPHSFFSEISGLQMLSISNNGLEFIHREQFIGQRSLVKLDCSKNLLTSLDEIILKDLHNLKFLDLSDNQLNKLPEHLFRDCHSLSVIHLEKNDLVVLPDQLFKPVFYSIKTVDLSCNPIQQVPLLLIYAPEILNVLLQNTSITGESITTFISQLTIPDMDAAVSKTMLVTLEEQNSESQPKETRRLLDLSFCHINSIRLMNILKSGTDSITGTATFAKLLNKFRVNFNGNPLDCACDNYDLRNVFLIVLGSSELRSDIMFDTSITLTCASPSQFMGRHLTSIRQEDMYCPVDLKACPKECTCSLRMDNLTVVIECQGTNISNFPSSLPSALLELWFKNTLIGMISSRNYLTNITVLDVRGSKVNYINPAIFGNLKKLKSLYLDSNLISTLPVQLSGLNLTAVTLGNNPYLCDCRLAWMKQWLIEHESTVTDWENVKCTDGRKKGQQVITVDDAHFTCDEEKNFDSVRHVVFPSIIISCVALVLISLALLVCFRHNAMKVILYIYCGLHPFDKDNGCTVDYDAVTVYDFDDKGFMNTVVGYLSNEGFQVADMYRDFIVGLSFSENVKHFIQNSRRMVFLLSDQTMEDELMTLAWSLAYEKSLNSISNYIILIQNNKHVRSVKDATLNGFLKNRRCVRKDSSLLKQSLVYCMPTHTDRRVDEQRIILQTGTPTSISYPDTLHEYVKHELIPVVQEKTGQNLGLFEYQFQPGGALDEEILNCLDRCHRLIFILSNEALRDECKMMILKYAMAKNMTCDYNFLLVFTYRQVSASLMTVDVRDYIDKHVTARWEDEKFIDRLATALRFRQQVSALQGEVVHEHDTADDDAIDTNTDLPLV